MARLHTDPTIPSEQDALLAREASRALEQHRAADESLHLHVNKAGHEIAMLKLPAAAAKLLSQMLVEMGKGRALTLVPTDTEITTQQAADLLNVSRPYVIGLIDKGVLPSRMVGNQRRLPLADVLTHKAETKAKAYEAMKEIAAIDQELGLR